MARIIKLKWTELQRELAAKVAEGKTFDELVQAGYTKSLVSKVLNAIKTGQKPSEEAELGTENREPTPEAPQKFGGRVVEVGKITISPENWGMTQYGAILILDTYNKAKRDISYGGTIGEFLCDICEFYRRILNYKEVEYARPTSEGGGGTEENGGEGIRQIGQAAQ